MCMYVSTYLTSPPESKLSNKSVIFINRLRHTFNQRMQFEGNKLNYLNVY